MNNNQQAESLNKRSLIDVRTPEEFATGRAANSINMPLAQLENYLDELKQMGFVDLCCASGHRSSIAALILQKHNIPCRNVGAWYLHNNK